MKLQKIIACAFNTDTACVEVKYSDGTRLSIYTPGVEDGLNTTLAMRTEIDWLIYNKPLEYARLVLRWIRAVCQGVYRNTWDNGLREGTIDFLFWITDSRQFEFLQCIK